MKITGTLPADLAGNTVALISRMMTLDALSLGPCAVGAVSRREREAVKAAGLATDRGLTLEGASQLALIWDHLKGLSPRPF